MSKRLSTLRVAWWLVFAAPATMMAQWNTGIVEGVVTDANRNPLAGVAIFMDGDPGYHVERRTGSRGDFSAVLPYGAYRIGIEGEGEGRRVTVAALTTTFVHLSKGGMSVRRIGGAWIDTTHGNVYPEPHNMSAILLSREPSSVIDPLDFTGLFDNRLAVESSRGFSWTDTRFELNGMDATDSYQPGRPAMLPDVDAMEEIAVRGGFSETTSTAYATGAGVFLATPESAWHGLVSTSNTGAILSASNLPPAPDRGMVERTERFRWDTLDEAQAGGRIGRRADIFAAVAGQWSDRTVGLAAGDQGSRVLFANARGRWRWGDRDQFDALYSGSRIALSNFANPAGIEALEGGPNAPSFVLPEGFAGQSESDAMNFWQTGWIHAFQSSVLEARYGYSNARFDTPTQANGQSVVELTDGAVTGAAPIGNFASRPRQSATGSWQWPAHHHHISVGGAASFASPVNRFTAPSNRNLITAAGAPAFALLLNTPATTRERIAASNVFAADHWDVGRGVSLDLGVMGDFARGGPIAWNSASPRAGFAWQIPHARRLTVRGMYFRAYSPLGGRELDFANANSLSGSEYLWTGGDGAFEPGELGPLVMRFGGEYSSIAPGLRRPYADEVDAGASLRVAPGIETSIHLFRRDEKDRLAAIDVGVPASAYTPVTVAPGITVYDQNPATFGEDRYVLSNPPGLREQYTGLVAQVAGRWRGLVAHAAFTAEKSFGPANPGDALMENDPGVIGSLFANPNETVNTDNRDFMDRGYVGKIDAAYRLPGAIEISAVADYLDGLVFAEQLLVTGLAQGPIVVGATVRGSPEGGNRAEYVFNWNLRVSRGFAMRRGRIVAGMDLFNVTNEGQRIQESDLSGAAFLLRLPVAIQEPRSARILMRYEF